MRLVNLVQRVGERCGDSLVLFPNLITVNLARNRDFGASQSPSLLKICRCRGRSNAPIGVPIRIDELVGGSLQMRRVSEEAGRKAAAAYAGLGYFALDHVDVSPDLADFGPRLLP